MKAADTLDMALSCYHGHGATTLTMLLTLMLTLTLRSGSGQSAVPNSGMTDQLKTVITDQQNMYRSSIRAKDMLALRWENKLEAMAADWVDGCAFGHKYPEGYGENIYRSELYDDAAEVVVRGVLSWSVELSYMMVAERTGEPCCDENANTTLCCNYQQLVWGDTRKVGCALKKCANLTAPDHDYPNAWFFACYYEPPGNVAGRWPYQRAESFGDECSLCPYIYGTCTQYICHPSSFCKSIP